MVMMMPGRRPQPPPTKRGYQIYEVVSAYQKAIRRSDLDAALYWGLEGYGEKGEPSDNRQWMWNRLRTIVSEDIGPAAPGLPADVGALYGTYKAEKSKHSGVLQFAHATALAALAPKSRLVQWAVFALEDEHDVREIPDEALDKHTRKGKQLGRGYEHFFEEASKLLQPDPDRDAEILHWSHKYREVRRKQTGLEKGDGQGEVEKKLPNGDE